MKVKSESEFSQSSLTLHDMWTAAYQALPSMGFSKQENWSEKKKAMEWVAIAFYVNCYRCSNKCLN